MIPQSTIDLIKETVRIEEVVSEFVSLKKDGPRLKGLCPFHNEKSPSFSVTPAKNTFRCYGCKEGGDSITFIMKHEKKTYPEALKYLAGKYSILIEDNKGDIIDPEKCKPIIAARPAKPEEVDGVWTFETREFTETNINFVISKKVWEYLNQTANRLEDDASKEFTPEERKKSAIKRAIQVFGQYHFHALQSYSIVKNRRVTTITATAHFPIFMFDEGKWKKIYKPMEPDKANRFNYYNPEKKPLHDFIHGLDVIGKAYLDLQQKLLQEKEEGEDEDDEPKSKKKKKKVDKLTEIILCSGGSDGLNLAMLGHFPIWMNSESAKLTDGTFRNLQTKAAKIYNLPDIDNTGMRNAHALAMEHLQLHTIYLPMELKTKSVARGYGKDVRDYFKFWSPWDFLKLLKVAYPYQFWDVQSRYNKQGEYLGIGYNVRSKYMLNFLAKNGFYRYATEGEKEGYIYIHIKHNVVSKIEAKDIRDFVNQFLEHRQMDAELMDVFLATTKLNESSISNLPYIEIDFTDYDKDTQWMFFKDCVFKVSAAGIEELSTRDCDKFVWEDEIIPYDAERLPDFFDIAYNEEKGYDIDIKNKADMVFCYLINASRMFWREELEIRLEGIKDEAERARYCELQGFTEEEKVLAIGRPKETWEKYREDNKFEIAGELLTAAEKKEQKLHLINKIYAIGYFLHRHKTMSETYCLWAMDAKITDANESHGRSGKSVMLYIISQFMRTETIPGRNQKIVDDKHIFGNVTKHTDFIFVDDAHPYLSFDFFFPYITGPMTCDPKNNKKYTLSFADSPKLGFASNHAPKSDGGSSIAARILYCMFGDYYHVNQYDSYRESRKVSDDFDGKTLIQDFDADEWNLCINFMAQCLQFYFKHRRKVDPPMDNVNKRNLKAEMGDAFQGWADVYFAVDEKTPDDHKFDKFLVREELTQDFYKRTRLEFTPNKFLKSMKAWCHYFGYEFNPKEFCNSGGRIIRKHSHRTLPGEPPGEPISTEMFFIRRKDTTAAPQP